MQPKYIVVFLSVCLLFTSQVSGACTCAPNDTACLQKCVTDGQNCITSCKGNDICYNNCISSYWPGQYEATSTCTRVSTIVPSTTVTTRLSTVPVVVSSEVPTSLAHPIFPTAILSSIVSVASSAASAASSNIVVSRSTTAILSGATTSYRPIPPTSSTAHNPTISGASKPFLVPAVAISVATMTICVQFFFLARMSASLFN